jgi:hypothetical protein
MNRKIATAAVAGLAAIGSATLSLGAATAAGASTPTPTVGASTSSPSHALRTWLHNHRRRVARDVIVVSAGAIHITPSALVTELRSGKSIAAVATEHSVTPQTVVNVLVTKGDARIDKAVANHKLSAARAAKLKTALPAWADKVVNHVFGQHAS